MSEINLKLKNDLFISEKLFSEGKYEDSIKKYQEILIDFPKLISAINHMGQSYEQLNQLDKSIECFKKCLLIEPNTLTAINNIVVIYLKKNNYGNAIVYATNSLIIDSSQINMVAIKTKCLIKLDFIVEAKLFLHPHLLKHPNNDTLNAIYGRILLALNQHEDGLKALKKGAGFIEFDEDKIRIVN